MSLIIYIPKIQTITYNLTLKNIIDAKKQTKDPLSKKVCLSVSLWYIASFQHFYKRPTSRHLNTL